MLIIAVETVRCCRRSLLDNIVTDDKSKTESNPNSSKANGRQESIKKQPVTNEKDASSQPVKRVQPRSAAAARQVRNCARTSLAADGCHCNAVGVSVSHLFASRCCSLSASLSAETLRQLMADTSI